VTNIRYAPLYSNKNAIGIIIATGNVGNYLSNRKDEINTYLSRDAGLTWFEVMKGSHIYEIGDHGGLIVMASDQEATSTIYYSWDEGLSWEEFTFSEEAIEVTNIIIEPSNTSQKFIIYGETTLTTGQKK